VRAAWLFFFGLSGGCAALSGLDGLHAGDAGEAADVQTETSAEAGADGPDTLDATDAHDADAGPPSGLTCGTDVCAGSTPVCCETVGDTTTFKCVESNAACSTSTQQVPIDCWSDADCKPGLLCCGFPNGPMSPVAGCTTFTTASRVSCETTCDTTQGEFEVGCSIQLQNCTDGTKTCLNSQCTLPGHTVCN